ncbi:MAG: tRNA (guanine(26)-N(2))-dimethyltransferase, partial [Halobacteriaceae archaeon]
GTPIPFADAALSNARDLVCVTATDTAPLCGAHFASGVRKYSAIPRNTEYHPEMGLRILLSALIRTAARYDVGARPLLSHVSDHYVRTYLKIEPGARRADEFIDLLGYIYHCPECLWRRTEKTLIASPPGSCQNCQSDQLVTAGPVWLGKSHDGDFVRDTMNDLDDSMGKRDRAHGLLDRMDDELYEPTHYDQHRLTKRWGKPATSMETLLTSLRDSGFNASRTHFGGTTFKTNASVSQIRRVVSGS